MLTTKSTLAGGIAALALLAAGTASAQSAPLNYQQHLTCSAMFFAFSKISSDPEDVGALEAATGVMLNRAQALPAARGLSEDQVIEAAVAEAVQIMERVDAQSGMTAKQQVIYSWGPGLDRCLEAVLEEV
ncbi:MAG: hypothetical protein Q8R97_00335 [Brevundimonas sp.]|uniref:hypothetical protein n=1 Tax=Brevundimonas sp. TaxID=1871086 RepID=UPI00274E7051|nr:hypothetical protein [Brevundimonas sp.]MDP3399549.1 hypothetical protein [Brevundimonas sp.]MDZ4108498.1 hypothetical protein [Brevundimonas sp.]